MSGASRTYLALDRQSFDEGRLDVAAFFTLAITATDFGGISREARTEILGRTPVSRVAAALSWLSCCATCGDGMVRLWKGACEDMAQRDLASLEATDDGQGPSLPRNGRADFHSECNAS